ncbi:hypothetical protein Hanom_Chr12g01117421 [Helianthus anomalus]
MGRNIFWSKRVISEKYQFGAGQKWLTKMIHLETDRSLKKYHTEFTQYTCFRGG